MLVAISLRQPLCLFAQKGRIGTVVVFDSDDNGMGMACLHADPLD